jgi:hypothetical protein
MGETEQKSPCLFKPSEDQMLSQHCESSGSDRPAESPNSASTPYAPPEGLFSILMVCVSLG